MHWKETSKARVTHLVTLYLMHQWCRASVLKAPVCSQGNGRVAPLGEVGWGPDVASVPVAASRNIFSYVLLDGVFDAFIFLGVCKGF